MSTTTTAKRSHAGFFSTARTFFLPVGEQVETENVRGYPIDLRIKAQSLEFPPPGVSFERLHVNALQYGLGCYERWLAGDGGQWLEAALAAGRHVLAKQDPGGALWHTRPFPHTFHLPPPWCSGLAQGEAASLLVRLHLETREPELAQGARLALQPLFTPISEGGVRGDLDGSPWPEEYPTDPPAHVLNGAMFALWGMRDVALGLEDAEAGEQFELGIDSLARKLHRYDAGYWSLYSLFPHPVPNVASSFYHALHVSQLEAMQRFAPRPEFERIRLRWMGYSESAACRRRAFASKALFRALVPRNRLLAHRMPWRRGAPWHSIAGDK